MDLGLEGKVAVVTGAASKKGIGNAVALALAKEGADVVVTDILNEGIEELSHEISKMGRKTLALTADQSRYEDVEKAVATVKGEFGRADIQVNCAALTSNFGSIARMKPEKWTKEIDVNLNGAFYWIQQVLPLMRENSWGRIVNISSVAGIFGTTGLPAYAVTKGALHTLTKQTARENATSGITANCLVLGIIATEIYERGMVDEATVEKLVTGIPLGRMGDPSEIGNMAAFVCSKQASYLTGAVIPVDGALSVSI